MGAAVSGTLLVALACAVPGLAKTPQAPTNTPADDALDRTPGEHRAKHKTTTPQTAGASNGTAAIGRCQLNAGKAAKPKNGDVLFQADVLNYDSQNEIVTADGNVEASFWGCVLVANHVEYDVKNDIVRAVGDVSIMEPSGNVVFAKSVELTNGLQEGVVSSFSGVLAENSRIAAQTATRKPGNITEMRHVVYSPCRICSKAGLRAAVAGEGGARDARRGQEDDLLPERGFGGERRPRLLHALLRALRPLGEAQVRLPHSLRRLVERSRKLRANSLLPDPRAQPGHHVRARVHDRRRGRHGGGIPSAHGPRPDAAAGERRLRHDPEHGRRRARAQHLAQPPLWRRPFPIQRRLGLWLQRPAHVRRHLPQEVPDLADLGPRPPAHADLRRGHRRPRLCEPRILLFPRTSRDRRSGQDSPRPAARQSRLVPASALRRRPVQGRSERRQHHAGGRARQQPHLRLR